ncbi:MAG TPA: DUF4290 domain-containing protein [Bacteroidales bacterium]|nr:DUF4290 domain-containing protein [Bacteroidales bacterium]
MEYNSQRSKMSISEYGRNIQKMIEQIMEIEDPEKRNHQARAIINIMGQLNPHLRDVADFKHKLWDHLFIMSGFKLDVNSPYPIPSPQILSRKPEHLSYANNHIKFKHYGRHIEKIIEKANEFEEGAEKTALIKLIANHLKKSYLTWNRDAVTDEEIASHLNELSQGKLKLDESIKLTHPVEGLTSSKSNKRKKFHPKPMSGKPFQFRGKKPKPI